MFEQPILIYSDYCNHSTKFRQELLKNVNLAEMFYQLNIDVDPTTKKRNALFYEIQNKLQYKISEVPTIIVEEGQYVLSGAEAFKWLEYTTLKLKKKDLVAFNPNEMGTFSDSYSKYGANSLNDASEQSFIFLNKEYDKMETPLEENINGHDYTQYQKERENFSMPLQQKVTDENVFLQKSYQSSSNSKANKKQNDIDKRYQELLSTREEFVPVKKQTARVDFTNGRMM